MAAWHPPLPFWETRGLRWWDYPVPPARPPGLVTALTDAFWHAPGVQHSLIVLAALLSAFILAWALRYWRYRARAGEVLPDAPARHEHFSYLRNQWRRPLTAAYALLSAGGLYGLWAVFTKSPALYPLLVTLAVMAPWTLYTAVVALRRPSISNETHSTRIASFGRLSPVDVFITVCGEDHAVVRNTFAHVATLEWSAELRVYVLDDSRDDSLREASGEYGFTYLRRPDRPAFKKSGNLNHGLSQSHGRFVAVFDADFAPAPSFLAETISYFTETDVGIVQTSQYFSTTRRDTVNWIARLGGVVQGMFFCWAQPGQQSRDAAFCVGTNVLYRRAALDEIGGIPLCPSGGEDVVTSVQLLARGYRTVYVPLNLARGLCPDNFTSVINQQYRWCLTTLALVFPVRHTERADRGFWRCRMTLTQRAGYLSGILYYVQSLLTPVVSVAPALIMLWCYPYQVGPGNYLPIAPAMLSMATLPLMLPGWRPEMLRISLVHAVAHLLATADAVTGRIQGWVPTGSTAKSGRNRRPLYAGLILRSWVVVTQGLTWWALARDIPVYGLPAYWIPAVLAAVQGVVLFPLLLPDYGTTGIDLRRINAHLVRYFRRPGRDTARSRLLDLLRQPGGRREPGTAVLRARGGSVQRAGAGGHRKPRQRNIPGMERAVTVPVREGVDERVLAGGRVPQPHRRVPAAAGQQPPVRAERHTTDRAWRRSGCAGARRWPGPTAAPHDPCWRWPAAARPG